MNNGLTREELFLGIDVKDWRAFDVVHDALSKIAGGSHILKTLEEVE